MRAKAGWILLGLAVGGCESNDTSNGTLAPDAGVTDAPDVVAAGDSPALDAADAGGNVSDAGVTDAPDVVAAGDGPALDAADAGGDVPDAAPAARCGDGLCTPGAETCMSCPLDCTRCTTCDMAPMCTAALAVPTRSDALASCNNSEGATDRTSYACGADLGVAPSATSCADPQLRIRIRGISIRQGLFSVRRSLYCVVSAQDDAHSELLLMTPQLVDDRGATTQINLPPNQGQFWGQGGLYRSASNVTIAFSCWLIVGADAAQRDLDWIAGRARMAAERADGYGWVFGTTAAVGTVLGPALVAFRDTLILNVRQTIDVRALLSLANARNWEIRNRNGTLGGNGSDIRVTIESWGCADARASAP